jgi:hypothetical protein
MTRRPAPAAPGRRLVAVLVAAAAAPWAQSQTIGALQGEAHVSPFANSSVTGIRGIVTAVDANGFWIQDAGDGNALTSDAIYVFRGSGGSKPVVGADVSVGGRVQEFRPGGNANNLTTTQINATSGAGGSLSTLSTGNALPAAAVVGAGFLPPLAIAPDVGNVETAPGYRLDPSTYAMDYYEALEGMRVSLPSAVAVGPNKAFGELPVIASAQVGAAITSPRGGVVVGPGSFNGHRIILDDRLVATPLVNSGAQLSGVVGVMDYSFSNYKLLVTQAPTVVSNALQRETASLAPGRFGLASYNVLNLGGDAPQSRIDAIAGQIANGLSAPHLIALQEVQDNDGAIDSGTTADDVTLSRLAAAVSAQTGRTYKAVSVDPANNTDGGQPGGNIRNAFLYDTSRVSFSEVVGGPLDAITATAGSGGRIELNLGAGRIDPANPAFDDSRKPLVADFSVDGQQIIVVNNHFNSKGGDQPLFGPNQAPVRSTEVQRLAQAEAVASFVEGLLAINPFANIVVTGDFNDFQFAETLDPLAEAGLVNLTGLLPEGERYTYNFEGNLQALDHMWVSKNLLGKGDWAYDIVHMNSEFFDQVSDHDPLLLSLGLVPAPVPEPATLALMLAGMLVVARAARRRG